MHKLFLTLFIFSLLVGCTPAAVATPTANADHQNRLVVTPVFGTVTVISLPPGQASLVLIVSLESSVSLGKVKIGDTGKAIGIDASGKWMQVEIKQQTGWLPVQYLDYTIAQ